MRRIVNAVILGSAASVLAACSSLNPFASSAPKPAELVAFQSSAELRPLWSANIGDAGPFVFQPEVVGDSVYAAAHGGTVARYQDGRAQWSVRVGKRLSAGVGSDGRLVVVVSVDGEAIALDAASGAERWRVPVGAEVLAAPAMSSDIVVLRASDNRLIGLDARDGARRWVYQRATPPLALRSFAGIVVVENSVAIAGFPGGKLAAVNLANGGELWELSVTVPVRPDGKISVPLIGDVAAGGRSAQAVAADIEAQLAAYVREPKVAVILTELRSHEFLSRVRVTGAVNRPVSLPYRQGMTVLDAVLEAGGVNDFAAAGRTRLYRKENGGATQSFPVDLQRILRRGDLETNIEVRPGDVITVPERVL